MIEYRPSPSVTAVRVFSISTSLAASTVTPGRTAPEVSLTMPAIVLCADAVDGTSASRATTPRARTANLILIGLSLHQMSRRRTPGCADVTRGPVICQTSSCLVSHLWEILLARCHLVVRSSHAADADIGSMDAVRTGCWACVGTGRHEGRGGAVQNPDQRAEPLDTDQPRTPRPAARLHVLPPAVPEHPQGEKVRLGRRLSASGLQLHGAAPRAAQNNDQPVEQWLPRLCERHRHGSRSLPVSVPAHAECGQLRLHTCRDRPHARLPAEGRLSLDRRQLGSGLRVHPSESHANPARRKDRRPAGGAPDVLDSLPRQPAPADPVARFVAAYASGF